jgi:hypothetical protein
VQPGAHPTDFLTSNQTPARTEVAESYGEVGRIPHGTQHSQLAGCAVAGEAAWIDAAHGA